MPSHSSIASLKRLATALLASSAITGTLYGADMPDTGSDWYRHAAISPDGSQIAFTYKGNLYAVPASGGRATPITVQEGWEGYPVWSQDGKTLAFSADRHGNLDVYMVPAKGGKVTRLTHHSSNDIPTDFAPDGSHILVSSSRQDSADARVGFTSAPELYTVPLSGGSPTRILTTAASEARYSADGAKIVYRGETGYENEFRKHDKSPFSRDVWSVDLKSGKHTNLTQTPGGDHSPLMADDGSVYYLSDRDGIFNVYQQKRGRVTKLTDFGLHPVRSLSAADDGTLAFTWHGGLFTLKDGGTPTRVSVSIAAEPAADTQMQSIGRGVDEFAASPDGKEIAFITEGDVFVTSMEYGTTVQVTATPEEEKNVAFSPDGETLYYASERDGAWGIYTVKRGDEDEPYFYRSTKLVEEKMNLGVTHAIQPLPSPDGKKLAFTADRLTVAVYDMDADKLYKLSDPIETYGTRDGDTTMTWSPDSQKLAYDIASNGRLFFTNIAVQPFDGSSPARDISLSGYTDMVPSWHPSGDAIIWLSARYGQRDHGSHGAEYDVLAGFLTQDAWNSFNLNKEDTALLKEAEEAAKKKAEKEKKDEDAEESAEKPEETDETPETPIDYTVLEDLQERLTVHSSRLGDAVLSKDMDKLFYLSAFEEGYDLWEQDFKEGSTKVLAKLNARGGSLELSKDGKKLIVNAGGRLMSVDVANGKSKPIQINAQRQTDMDATRAYVYDHAWRQAKDRFYKAHAGDYHGVDWDVIGAAYRAKLPSVGTNRDLAEVLSELLGELNASHTGGRYRPTNRLENTPSIGALFDITETGQAVLTHVFAKGPLRQANGDVSVGHKITGVDGTTLTADTNIYDLLNNTGGKRIRLTMADAEGGAYDLVIRPTSLGAESGWRYERWVQSRAEEVDRLSDGRLGYVHLPSMSDRTYRRVYRDIFGKYFDREALVVDTRWNRGGDLMEDLIRLLTSGDMQYTNNAPLGQKAQGEPLNRWTKPTIVLMNEANYSDGHCFPAAYNRVKGGKLVGAPVTGTCTYVWWERTIIPGVIFGVPTLGIFDPDGDWMENKHLQPDIKVYNSPEDYAAGRDPQLEAAVKELLKELR